MTERMPDRIAVTPSGSVRYPLPGDQWDNLAPIEVQPDETIYVREDRMRRFVHAVSCRCAIGAAIAKDLSARERALREKERCS